MPHRPGHTGQTAPGTGQFHPIGREGSGPGILEKIMAMLSGGLGRLDRSRINPETDTAEDAYRVFAPPVDEPSLEHEVRRPVLQAGPQQRSQLQPEMNWEDTPTREGNERFLSGTGVQLEDIMKILENPRSLAFETEGPIPHAFEAARQLESQRNEPERLLRQLLDKYAKSVQQGEPFSYEGITPSQIQENIEREKEHGQWRGRGQGINLIREGGPALEARDRSRVGRPQFTPSRTGITQADIMRGGPSIRFPPAGTIHGQSTARSRR